MHLCSIRHCPSGLGGYYALLVDSKVTQTVSRALQYKQCFSMMSCCTKYFGASLNSGAQHSKSWREVCTAVPNIFFSSTQKHTRVKHTNSHWRQRWGPPPNDFIPAVCKVPWFVWVVVMMMMILWQQFLKEAGFYGWSLEKIRLK